jgi:hypothetical protein
MWFGLLPAHHNSERGSPKDEEDPEPKTKNFVIDLYEELESSVLA